MLIDTTQKIFEKYTLQSVNGKKITYTDAVFTGEVGLPGTWAVVTLEESVIRCWKHKFGYEIAPGPDSCDVVIGITPKFQLHFDRVLTREVWKEAMGGLFMYRGVRYVTPHESEYSGCVVNGEYYERVLFNAIAMDLQGYKGTGQKIVWKLKYAFAGGTVAPKNHGQAGDLPSVQS